LRSEADESHRKSSHLMKENTKHQQAIRDLSKQVGPFDFILNCKLFKPTTKG